MVNKLQSKVIFMKSWLTKQVDVCVCVCAAPNLTCLMLKLDTDMIMVGLLQISSGLTQREKTAFCLGDRASFPDLSLRTKQH